MTTVSGGRSAVAQPALSKPTTRHNLDTMAAAGARLDRAVAVGGGTASRVWPQIVSDVTGRAQEIPAARPSPAQAGRGSPP